MSQKYYYRIDGQNHPIPGTLARLSEKPITGKWREVPADICCAGEATAHNVNLINFSHDNITISGLLAGAKTLSYMVDTPAVVYNNNILKFSNGVGFSIEVQLLLNGVIVNSSTVANNGYKDLGSFVFDTIRVTEAV